ncbi:tripartite tricarboxylate transporter substrate-binding protein [Roseiarcaceae bacterium H3SJ34-1]|uniref:Bug family tripartite tricarboxylate transporter substrate binding protein n=1 Tax=Terripilifer ovatus TaxID=3032367 RepID=UPI003AB9B27B|nr:tripartite tricarboxylate transporter substrate-binding protein [Roseiarcaceae bacterium H3SJ34-1]
MMIERRHFLQMVATTSLAAGLPSDVRAQAYPAAAIRLLVGFPPGNAPDTVARLIGNQLSGLLGQSVVIENRAGAASGIATRLVASAPPDGYTLLQVTPANAINPEFGGGGLFARDIAPVASVANGPMVLVVAAASPVRSVADVIAQARSKPDAMTIGSPGTGSTPYLAAVLFKMMTDLNITHVPFSGSADAVNELLGGRVQVVVADMSAIELIRAGTVRAVAVTTAKRQKALPDVPTVAETVPGYEASTWYGIGAPRGTPPQVIERLNAAIKSALSNQSLTERLNVLGFEPDTGPPSAFGRLVEEETAKWAKVTKFVEAKR